jgi:hypothetical protein
MVGLLTKNKGTFLLSFHDWRFARVRIATTEDCFAYLSWHFASMMPSDISNIFLNPIPRRLATHEQQVEKG